MATIEEMCKTINTIEGEDQGWIARVVCGQPARFPDSIVREVIWYALRHAEDDGQCYNVMHGDSEWRTFWRVGDYIISYYTDDEYFTTRMMPVSAEMLTEDMMDELIIEEGCDLEQEMTQDECDLAEVGKCPYFSVIEEAEQ